MQWKLGLGNMSKFFMGDTFLPSKYVVATERSWNIQPMPERDITTMQVNIPVSSLNMDIIKRGHIPEAQEDHWFMYCDYEYIRYYRSWSGSCSYVAHYRREEDHWLIDELTINHALVEFGVNGDEPGLFLFVYLIKAETGLDATKEWFDYIRIWKETYLKHLPREEKDAVSNERKNEEKQDNKGRNSVTIAEERNNFDQENYNVASYERYHEERLNKEHEEKIKLQQQLWKEKHQEALDKKDGTYEKMLIKRFIDEKLNGDIDKLPDFVFTTLKDDKIYGDCKGFAFTVEKCNIVQVIMSVVFDDLWPGLTIDSIEHYIYTINKINRSQYLFGANILDTFFKGLQKFNPSKELHERCVKVYYLLERIGNMWILPKGIDVDKDTAHYHGYADLYLQDLYNVIADKLSRANALKGQVYGAREQMGHLQGDEGFKNFAKGLFLDDYLDENGIPTDVLPHVWSMMNGLTKEEYFNAVEAYCSFMERFVEKRGKLITEKLKTVLDATGKQEKYIQKVLDEEQKNEFSKIGYAFVNELNRMAEYYKPAGGSLFYTLNCLSLEEGFTLKLKLAEQTGTGDTSTFYAIKEDQGEKPVIGIIPAPATLEGNDLPLPYIKVKRNAMGIWQAFLMYVSRTMLPTFWHGGYITRTYIFGHNDLKQINAIYNKRHDEGPLYGIRDVLTPQVKMRGNEGTIECCYWSEWKGLIKEYYSVKYGEETVAEFKLKKVDVLYEYDCGIFY